MDHYDCIFIILGAESDNFDKSIELMKKVEEFSQLNKDLKDRNDELEVKKCRKCQTLPNKDLEEEKVKNTGFDDGYSKLPFLYKVMHYHQFIHPFSSVLFFNIIIM